MPTSLQFMNSTSLKFEFVNFVLEKSQFEKVTFNTLFGRYSTANATANFYGTVDYIDIVTKKSVVLG